MPVLIFPNKRRSYPCEGAPFQCQSFNHFYIVTTAIFFFILRSVARDIQDKAETSCIVRALPKPGVWLLYYQAA
ncbi:MAG: hypothetical protein H6Q67_1959 [Firmicutes bacterium]|nr:hypothetical protein [Bacillota bacterium]